MLGSRTHPPKNQTGEKAHRLGDLPASKTEHVIPTNNVLVRVLHFYRFLKPYPPAVSAVHRVPGAAEVPGPDLGTGLATPFEALDTSRDSKDDEIEFGIWFALFGGCFCMFRGY